MSDETRSTRARRLRSRMEYQAPKLIADLDEVFKEFEEGRSGNEYQQFHQTKALEYLNGAARVAKTGGEWPKVAGLAALATAHETMANRPQFFTAELGTIPEAKIKEAERAKANDLDRDLRQSREAHGRAESDLLRAQNRVTQVEKAERDLYVKLCRAAGLEPSTNTSDDLVARVKQLAEGNAPIPRYRLADGIAPKRTYVKIEGVWRWCGHARGQDDSAYVLIEDVKP